MKRSDIRKFGAYGVGASADLSSRNSVPLLRHEPTSVRILFCDTARAKTIEPVHQTYPKSLFQQHVEADEAGTLQG